MRNTARVCNKSPPLAAMELKQISLAGKKYTKLSPERERESAVRPSVGKPRGQAAVRELVIGIIGRRVVYQPLPVFEHRYRFISPSNYYNIDVPIIIVRYDCFDRSEAIVFFSKNTAPSLRRTRRDVVLNNYKFPTWPKVVRDFSITMVTE